MIEFKPTEHSYYCSQNNYYSTDGQERYLNWSEFADEYGNCDLDYNMIFRFDIVYSSRYWNKYEDEEIDSSLLQDGDLELQLFMIQQRRGRFVPIIISEIRKRDIPDIENFLNKHYLYLKELWKEFEA